MTHWDGLASTNSRGEPQRICILGATNRIQDIDEAILRRMPKKFPVPLPSAKQRRGIFKLVLKGTKIDEPNFDLDYLVKLSAGLSGSDIKEACRDAAMLPMREFIRAQHAAGTLKRSINPDLIRGLRTDDFFRRAKENIDKTVGLVERELEVDEAEEQEAWTDASSDAGQEDTQRKGKEAAGTTSH